MARRKIETPEQKLERWMADATRTTSNYETIVGMGWEPGQVAYIEAHGMRYERFDVGGGLFVVIEWDDGGNVTVA
jgi:hypothetical protein